MRSRSLDERFREKYTLEPNTGCWLWTGYANQDGYGLIKVDGRVFRAHRVAWQLAGLKISDGLHVLHRCDNPPCVNPAHLFLGTPLDNARDRDSKGRKNSATGESVHTAKLTAAVVVAIRQELADGATTRAVSRKYGIGWSTAKDIKAKKTWRSVVTP